jgi:lysophospholipase L1-like esterase
MDIVTLAMAKAYVDETANGLGAVKGSPATIESITKVDGGNEVVFSWTGADGTKQTQTMFVADGGGNVDLDTSLTQSGKAADAKAVGDAINQLSEEIEQLKGGSEDDYREETITPDIQGYLLMTGNFNNTTTKARRTDYISLDGCTKIKAQYRIATNGCAVAFFDANKTFMADVSVAGVGLDADTITEMEPPDGAAFVMLSHYLGSDLNYVGFITLSYGTKTIVYDSNLAGKNISVLGDSISSVAYVTPNYWQLIAEKTGCAFNDYAVSGTRIATVEGDEKESFLTRAARMDTTADAVLVMGGTNDVGLDTLLGEWNSDDTSTFYGALNALIALLRTNFPGKPIVFCTPIKRKYDTDNGFPDTMADLKAASATEQITMQHCVLAIKAKCARHGIPVIDLADHSGFSALTPEYFRTDSDNLHPSALGHVRIANMVQAELETQFQYTE